MKKNMRKFSALLLMVLMLSQIAFACAAEADTYISENTITIGTEGFRDPLTIENVSQGKHLLVGQTLSLSVPEEYHDGVDWSSNNREVATVDQDGLVTAVAPGNVTIRVSDKVNPANSASVLLEVVDAGEQNDDVISILVEWSSLKGEIYDGTAKALTYTLSADDARFDPERVEFLGEIPSRVDCGITMGAITPEEFRYNDETMQASFVIKNGSIWIAPRGITVTADDAEKNAGEADPAFTWTAEGLAEADEGKEDLFELSFDRDPGEDPGTYGLRVTGEESQGNYRITFDEGKLTIHEAEKVRVSLASSAGLIIWEGDTVTLTATVEEPEEGARYSFLWEMNDGSGWQEVARGQDPTYTYVATADKLSVSWRVTAALE